MDINAEDHTSTRPRRKKPKQRKQKEKNLRCFFGIAFRQTNVLEPLQQQLLAVADDDDKLRLSPANNLHLTLSFLGSLPSSRVEEAKVIGSSICSKHAELQLSCHGAGSFKNSAWIGIQEDKGLLALAEDFRQAAVLLGIPPDTKAFQPHITVARFAPQARTRLLPVLDQFSGTRWLDFTVSKASLYLSETLQEGARYSILKSFRLGELPADPDAAVE